MARATMISTVIISGLIVVCTALLTYVLTQRSNREMILEKDIKELATNMANFAGRLLVIESEIRYITENLIFKTTKAYNDVNAAHEKIRRLEGLIK